MTRCGHVYCWPCILHYLALSDKKSWRKCPICYEAVHIGDLKSAVSKPHHNYNCDEYVTFQLMYRNKDSLQVCRAETSIEQNQLNGNLFPNLLDSCEQIKHSKLLLAKPQEILQIIERERTELKCQLVSDGIDCPDSIFVQQALDLLEEREKMIRSQFSSATEETGNINTIKGATVTDLNETLDKLQLNINAKEFIPCTSKENADDYIEQTDGQNSSTSTDSSQDIATDSNSSSAINDTDSFSTNASSNISNYFYFYQANDGQHLYLHSINVRMLKAMYGSFEHAPKTISGRILQKESCSMTEELRKRLKYLQHLPVTCQFDIVEIGLESPNIISGEVMDKFKNELSQRQKQRQKRAREEIKREKHIDLENEKRIGKIIRTTLNIDVTSDQQFPIVSKTIKQHLSMN